MPLYGPGGGAGRSEPAAARSPKILSRLPALTRHELEPTPLRRGLAARSDAEALLLGGEGEPGMAGFARVPLWDSVDACLDALDAAVLGVGVDRSVKPASGYHVGGEREALRKLDRFLESKLTNYASSRNDPSLRLQSHLSPHIHYGQISVVYVAHRARKVAAARPELRRSVDVFLDELVVRRELAINYCLNNPAYDAYEGVPEWARRTLATHATDHRSFVYTLEQFERCATHDALWTRGSGAVGEREQQTRADVLGQENFGGARTRGGVVLDVPEQQVLPGRRDPAATPASAGAGVHDRGSGGGGYGNGAEDVGGWHAVKFNAGISDYLNRWGDGMRGRGREEVRGESCRRAAAGRRGPELRAESGRRGWRRCSRRSQRPAAAAGVALIFVTLVMIFELCAIV